MSQLKNAVKQVLPKFIFRGLVGLFYGWTGNYKSWEEANKKCTGYDDETILSKITESALKVRDGIAPFEKDSVIYDKIQYSFPVLSALMWIAAQNEGKINVLDFGGSLGTRYFQNRQFLESLKEFNWCIVEQPQFVKTGKEKFANSNLHFFYSIDDCLKSFPIDVILFSSVLQYLESPYAMIDNVFSHKLRYIIIDLTRFLPDQNDRITIQKVPRKIYKARYACWFFNEMKFLNYFEKYYDLIYDFEIPELINVRSVCKGFLFQRK